MKKIIVILAMMLFLVGCGYKSSYYFNSIQKIKSNDEKEVAEYVVNNAKAGDLVLTMGCGDIYKSAFMMIERLKNGTV